MRLAEIADILTEIDRREPDELHIKLRNPLVKGMMNGVAGRSRNSPQDYPVKELVRARLLLALQDVGLTTTDLARANAVLNDALWNLVPRPASMGELGGVVPNALRCLIKGARAGEPWHLRAEFVRDADGARKVWVRVDCGDMAVRPEAKRVRKAREMLDGSKTMGILFVPASELIEPLLSFLPQEG